MKYGVHNNFPTGEFYSVWARDQLAGATHARFGGHTMCENGDAKRGPCTRFEFIVDDGVANRSIYYRHDVRLKKDEANALGATLTDVLNIALAMGGGP